jgi:hypothetical protein
VRNDLLQPAHGNMPREARNLLRQAHGRNVMPQDRESWFCRLLAWTGRRPYQKGNALDLENRTCRAAYPHVAVMGESQHLWCQIVRSMKPPDSTKGLASLVINTVCAQWPSTQPIAVVPGVSEARHVCMTAGMQSGRPGAQRPKPEGGAERQTGLAWTDSSVRLGSVGCIVGFSALSTAFDTAPWHKA